MDGPLVNEAVLGRVKGWRPYVEAKLGFRNHWYPALFSRELEEGKPVEATLLGESILINRVHGVARAIRNRCLHRGVKFSRRLECYKPGTITCWYHAFTYDWKDGRLVDIITNPSSALIGKHKLQTYPVIEAQGLVFVFVGHEEPPALAADVPPGFLDADRTIHGKRRVVRSNWRLGVENGFDASHIFIHKGSPLCAGNDIALPLGFAPTQPGTGTRPSIGAPGPIGLYDLLGESAIPVFEGTIGGETVLEGHFGEKRVADNISIWLPGVLKVDPWPQEGMQQFEWYVPVDATTHIYLQTLGRVTASPAEAEAFRQEVDDKWVDLALDGFNDDDVWAREATEEFYADNDRGWVEERLFEADIAIVQWRKLASEHNRGIQRPENL
ncbi:MAG: Rieske 2Fe-2S domain-containing protein [Burkholderiales bacterium]|nr:Rieske 2Fe-2S domain-containing protein [Burkholderiales bacterium]